MAKKDERRFGENARGEQMFNPEQLDSMAEHTAKKRTGICLCLSDESADLLRRVAGKMGVSQGSLREYLEGSQELKDAVTAGLRRRHEAWKVEAGEDLFPAVKEQAGE